MLRDEVSKGEDRNEYELVTVWTHGSSYACIGLIEATKTRLIEDGENVLSEEDWPEVGEDEDCAG
jgi:hypothetical protein